MVGVEFYAYPLTRGINHGSTTSIGEIEDPIFLLRPSFFHIGCESIVEPLRHEERPLPRMVNYLTSEARQPSEEFLGKLYTIFFSLSWSAVVNSPSTCFALAFMILSPNIANFPTMFASVLYEISTSPPSVSFKSMLVF